ncbi:riboflavin synthase alpha subunit RibE [Thermosynechococcus sp. NK55a]|jgi:riboflavin synthase|uniref:riboflavin synthase n=1 Tax=Thermosynechococcus sp. NK55a TaxID=1394889 RepID=UPI0003D8B283|nr:riboflavin synthase [Thermosynechococcus sp. NK55a]AHB88332.1 riboflavin synthase alpha subunit RibE [Thermosynechococcus sp. NK55a]RMH66882.1 MAG: riboflavin synthase [Cyanobacteria bacterium J003]
MFTGIIQAIGVLQQRSESQLVITASDAPFLGDVAIGDSIAVEGVCLTVETVDATGFTVSVSPETLQRTTLAAKAAAGAMVNLEPALRVGDRVGGHFVTGHVDGVGTLLAIAPTGTSWELTFSAPETVAVYIIPKGSIAINGISLTIAHCNEKGDEFSIAVIPHTYAETTLQFLRVGDGVNLEADLLGKYTRKFLQPQNASTAVNNEIDLAFLQTHGYA